MASTQQNRDFVATIIEWIKANLSPSDVFDDDQLAEYARNNIEIDDVYSESNILGYVTEGYRPEEVFAGTELEIWAEENGYVKK